MDEDNRVYDSVSVETVDVTEDAVIVNVYVSETDITTQELVDLIDNNLQTAIEEEVHSATIYFKQISKVTADTTLAEAQEEENTDGDSSSSGNNIPWDLIVIVICVAALAIIGYIIFRRYRNKQQSKHQESSNLSIGLDAATNGTYHTSVASASPVANTNAPSTPVADNNNTGNVKSNDPELPNETELVMVTSASDEANNLPSQPQVLPSVPSVDPELAGATSKPEAEMGDDLAQGDDGDDGDGDELVVEGGGAIVTGSGAEAGGGDVLNVEDNDDNRNIPTGTSKPTFHKPSVSGDNLSGDGSGKTTGGDSVGLLNQMYQNQKQSK